jgi:hypothetical protein
MGIKSSFSSEAIPAAFAAVFQAIDELLIGIEIKLLHLIARGIVVGSLGLSQNVDQSRPY